MSLARLLGFLLPATLIVFGAHYYVWARLVRAAHLPPGWERGLGVGIAVLACLVPLSLSLQRLGAPALRPLLFVTFAWMGTMSFLFLLTLAGDLVHLAAWVVERLRDVEPDPERRETLRRVLSVTVATLTAATGLFGVVSAFRPTKKRVTVPVRGLPEALSGFRIVQISDVHVGPLIQRGFIEDLVAEINALRPDMVAITGDLVDGPVDKLRDHVRPLGDIASRHGTFFVTGNHEYYAGVDDWRAHLRELGIKVLENERVRLPDGLDVAGVEDFRSRNWDMEKALGRREPGVPCVLLAHQPKHADLAAKHGVSLMLSGHTHGGQIWPWGLLAALDQKLLAGLHTVKDTVVYVSRGTGFWGPPLRVGAESEITEIILVRA